MSVLLTVLPSVLLQAICNDRQCCPNYQRMNPSAVCEANAVGAECTGAACAKADYFFGAGLGPKAIRGATTMQEGMDAWLDLPGSQIHNIPEHLLNNPVLFIGVDTVGALTGTITCGSGMVCEFYLSFYECGDCPNKPVGFYAIAARDGWKRMPCQMRFTTGSDSLTRHRLVTYVITATYGSPAYVGIPEGVGLAFLTVATGEDCLSYPPTICAAVPKCYWDTNAGHCSVGYCQVPRGPVLNQRCSDHSCAYDDVALLPWAPVV